MYLKITTAAALEKMVIFLPLISSWKQSLPADPSVNALLRFVLICKRYVHMYHICMHTYIYVCKCILHLHNPWIFLKIKYFLQMTRKLNTHRNIVNYKQKLHSFTRTSPSQLYHGFLCIFPEKFSIIYQQG